MNPTLPSELQTSYDQIIQAGTAKNTRLSYQSDMKLFWSWAHDKLNLTEHYPIAVETLIQFIIDRTTSIDKPFKVSTIRRYMASISVMHQERGLPSPTLDQSIKLLLRRTQHAQAQQTTCKKQGITHDLLQKMIATCDESLHGVRDKAIILVGFASGGRRRSELCNMQAEDLIKVDEGYLITLRSNKTDQRGSGLQVPILGDAATALKAWLVITGIRRGRLFRSITARGQLNESICGKSINQIIKKRVALAGANPALYAAHSLRSGFITEAGRQGIHLGEVMQLSGHKSLEIASGYYRKGEILKNPAGKIS